MDRNSYLLIPSCSEGNGTGHLKRMIDLYKALKNVFRVSVFITIKEISVIHKSLLKESIDKNDILFESLPDSGVWDFIIVDYRSSPDQLISNLKHKGFLIGIDEGSNNRKYFNYLIDIIPSISDSIPANITSIALMNLPERFDYKLTTSFKKILISFGGEDFLNLTGKLLTFIHEKKYFTDSEITIIDNKDRIFENFSESVKILKIQKDLSKILKNFDLVFTSFGLTAFETLASGVPFVLLNPSEYHKKLSIKCGFFEIGITKPNKKKLDHFLFQLADFKDLQKKFIPEKYLKLKDLILFLNITESICPVCGHNCEPINIINRFETKNFYKCPICHITFLENYQLPSDSYTKGYFFDDYTKQYGKTYLEDFNNIQQMAVSRLKKINSIMGRKDRLNSELKLLDVGCAYGPFLVESSRCGFSPGGVELIPEAADYVHSEFGFPVLTGSFEELMFTETYDVITMWYVIEHFIDTGLILAKVNKLLKTGAVFAFSTPNSAGISGRKKISDFLNESPLDHITIWSPGISENVLKRYGFKIKGIKITGHHPERFPFLDKIKLKFGYRLVNQLSRLFKLGDTFEVYAVKVKEIDV
jgi:2-polyprenyl-3-methyl-5-hydroxy-6-metoxy-1,4-benzoquinol methylase/spore coat polysaccharide biosynthesis predicted glycosyltransferase SpsG